MELVESRYGKLIASRNDKYVGGSLFEYGEFSEGEVEIFRQIVRKDHIVVDIGANIGAHTLALSRLAKHVYAFEPVPKLYHAVCGMIALNDLDNVTACQVAVSEREGRMSYLDIDWDQPNNFGGAYLTSFDGDRSVNVIPMTIPCHFMKIDVEGMELQVLKGAQDMIREYMPGLYMENDRPERSEELIDFVRSLGYVPHWHCPSLYNPHNRNGSKRDIFEGVGSINMLCAPVKLPGMEEAKDWHFTQGAGHGLENR
jgi:FkbM family methyltransferase